LLLFLRAPGVGDLRGALLRVTLEAQGFVLLPALDLRPRHGLSPSVVYLALSGEWLESAHGEAQTSGSRGPGVDEIDVARTAGSGSQIAGTSIERLAVLLERAA